MSLTPGVRLGAYEVLGLIGAGGMGEVYKARDTRLDRTVAIKVLPEELAANPDRRMRFEREARAVAALNHSHICALHDVGESPSPGATASSPESIRFLVMEYLEGQTLAERLVRGPLPASEVLRCAIELADALDHAHRRGLVHRDLKPGNVMMTKGGAKLLDFGLSRLQSSQDLLALSTIAPGGVPLTAEGTVLGTFPYMAPEQLAGREADARSDIFAFGAMVYEMATGRRAFEGTTAATLIGAILHTDPPPASSLQPLTPAALDRIVARCLAKDPDDRWQSARDLMLELKWIAEHATPPEASSGRQRKFGLIASAASTVAVLAIAALAFMTVAYIRRAPSEEPVVRLPFSPPDGLALDDETLGDAVTISPDGQRLVFVATGADGKQLLWVRPLDSLAAQPLVGTDGGAYPFWSPDSRFIGFFAQGKLRKIQVAEGPPQTLCDALQPRGGSWSRDDVVVFAAGAGYEFYRVSAGGGMATAIPADGINQERLQPSFLPDGRHFLYYGRPQQFGIYVGLLDSSKVTLLSKDYVAVASASPGYLLFLRGTSQASIAMTLLAQPFDPASLQLTGDPEAVADRIRYDSLLAHGAFSVSKNGTLVYGTVESRTTQLKWFDRSGKPLGNVGSSGAFSQPALSPDEKTIAVRRTDPESQDSDLWLIETTRGIELRFTTYGTINFNPVWSPDGTQIVFASSRLAPPHLYLKASSGGDEQLLFQSNFVSHTTDWSREGRFIIYAAQNPRTGWDLMRLPMSVADAERKPETLLQTAFNEHLGRVSPDGRWLAYMSDESGRNDVYVRTFPDSGAKWLISTNGGVDPRWRADGTELFYLAADGSLMAVSIKPGPVFEPGAAVALFKTRMSPPHFWEQNYAVTRDGGRFLINTITEESASVPTKIIFNWTAALRRR
jgi:serine/threonine protein kinase/Tol biopolymer transport system component